MCSDLQLTPKKKKKKGKEEVKCKFIHQRAVIYNEFHSDLIGLYFTDDLSERHAKEVLRYRAHSVFINLV